MGKAIELKDTVIVYLKNCVACGKTYWLRKMIDYTPSDMYCSDDCWFKRKE